jgi:hypothetical protein
MAGGHREGVVTPTCMAEILVFMTRFWVGILVKNMDLNGIDLI